MSYHRSDTKRIEPLACRIRRIRPIRIHSTAKPRRTGIYGSYSTRILPPYYAQKYFQACEESLQVKPLVRSAVNFSRLNLSDDARMTFMKNLDVILCCNVLIHFDLVSKRRAIQHFFNNLLPHGYLFLGHSESLYGVSNDFRLVHFPGATAYIKGERTESER